MEVLRADLGVPIVVNSCRGRVDWNGVWHNVSWEHLHRIGADVD